MEYEKLAGKTLGESSAEVRARVEAARKRQQARFAGSALYANADMGPAEVRQYCELDAAGRALIKAAMCKWASAPAPITACSSWRAPSPTSPVGSRSRRRISEALQGEKMQGNSVTWVCSACGTVGPGQLQTYRSDGVFNAHSMRVGPWCPTCGKRLRASFADHDGPIQRSRKDSPSVLLISGSCASGKTTLSYIVAGRADAVQIDGDWILHLRKEESGGTIAPKAIDLEICRIAEAFVRLGKRVVIAQVVLPDGIGTYRDYFVARGIDYRFIVLMPSMPVILRRNETRKCWPKTTPEYWVQKFWDDLDAGPESFRAAFHDNSDESPELTAANIMAACHWAAEREGMVP